MDLGTGGHFFQKPTRIHTSRVTTSTRTHIKASKSLFGRNDLKERLLTEKSNFMDVLQIPFFGCLHLVRHR